MLYDAHLWQLTGVGRFADAVWFKLYICEAQVECSWSAVRANSQGWLSVDDLIRAVQEHLASLVRASTNSRSRARPWWRSAGTCALVQCAHGCKQRFLAGDAVLQTPPAGAVRLHWQLKTPGVEQLRRAVDGQGVLDRKPGQRYGGNSSEYPRLPPKLPLGFPGCRRASPDDGERSTGWEASCDAGFRTLANVAGLARCAGGGTRTHTLLPETDFESVASTNSATPA